MKCIACLKGRKWECEYRGECSEHIPNTASSPEEIESPVGESPIREINTYKDDAVLKDQQSTGRKRAAVMYPLDSEQDCEWKLKDKCGGGSYPIMGCRDGKQQARHHGPDKNTLNNDEGNVHRICHTCHNRWHYRNDDEYVWGSVYNPHSPVGATIEAVVMNEIHWTGKTLKNVKD